MVGARALVEQLLSLDPIPDLPLDPNALSRDASVGKLAQAIRSSGTAPSNAPCLRP
jgi:hypothetical protein